MGLSLILFLEIHLDADWWKVQQKQSIFDWSVRANFLIGGMKNWVVIFAACVILILPFQMTLLVVARNVYTFLFPVKITPPEVVKRFTSLSENFPTLQVIAPTMYRKTTGYKYLYQTWNSFDSTLRNFNVDFKLNTFSRWNITPTDYPIEINNKIGRAHV